LNVNALEQALKADMALFIANFGNPSVRTELAVQKTTLNAVFTFMLPYQETHNPLFRAVERKRLVAFCR
jgi:hypothetical protein